MGIKIPIVSDIVEAAKDIVSKAAPILSVIPGAPQVNSILDLLNKFDPSDDDAEIEADAAQQQSANQNLRSILYGFDVT